MRSLLVASMFLVLGLAGCTEPTAELQSGDVARGTELDLLDVPVWTVGQWWTFEFTSGDQITWVVSGEDSKSWILDVDNPATAFDHAAFDEYSTIGPMSKAGLDGTEGDQSVKFFEFPLTLGASWSLDWDGESWNAEIVDLDGTEATVAYSQGGVVGREITYDGELGWMRNLRWVDENGTEQWSAKYVRGGQSFTGEIVRYDVFDGHSESRSGFGNAGSNTFNVPEDAGEIWYAIGAFCNPEGFEGDQGTYGYRIDGPDSAAEPYYAEIWACPDGTGPAGDTGVWPDPPAGQWTAQGFSFGGTVDALLVPRTEHRYTLSEVPA